MWSWRLYLNAEIQKHPAGRREQLIHTTWKVVKKLRAHSSCYCQPTRHRTIRNIQRKILPDDLLEKYVTRVISTHFRTATYNKRAQVRLLLLLRLGPFLSLRRFSMLMSLPTVRGLQALAFTSSRCSVCMALSLLPVLRDEDEKLYGIIAGKE